VLAPVLPSGGERDEDEAVAAVIASRAPVESRQVQDAQPDTHQQTAAPNGDSADKDYSDAVAAIAASLTTRLGESARDQAEDAAVPAREAQPQRPASRSLSQDNSPRWHIEAPDFVFGAEALDATLITAEPQRETAQLQSQLLGAEIMSERTVPLAAGRQETRQETRQESGQEAQSRLTAAEAAVVDTIVEAAIETPPASAEPAKPVSPTALDVVPLVEISRPQLRIAREAMPVSQRAPRFGSLTVTDALSEDEVIALFG
jgi:hypothetical protein